MIRYALAVVLTASLVAVGFAGVDHASTVRGEQQVESQIAEIERAAVSLIEHDDAPPTGQPGPRRVLELDFPHSGPFSASVDRFSIQPDVERPVGNGSQPVVSAGSMAQYTFDGRAQQTVVMDVRIRSPEQSGSRAVRFDGETGRQTVVLELRADDHGEYVVLRRWSTRCVSRIERRPVGSPEP